MKHWFSDLNAFRRDPLQVLLDKGNGATEPLVRLDLGPAPMFLVTDPDSIRPLLKASEEDFDKGKLIHKLRSVVGLSSLTMSGSEYVRRREVLHKYMAKGAVERLTTPMAAEIRAVGAQLARKRSFNPHEALAPLALKMVCIALFGRQVLSQAGDREGGPLGRGRSGRRAVPGRAALALGRLCPQQAPRLRPQDHEHRRPARQGSRP
jgi:cytochrome P450